MNVISECLKTAIIKVTRAMKIDGIAASSAHIFGASEPNNEYAIDHPIIMIINCLRLNPKKIGSSFSI